MLNPGFLAIGEERTHGRKQNKQELALCISVINSFPRMKLVQFSDFFLKGNKMLVKAIMAAYIYGLWWAVHCCQYVSLCSLVLKCVILGYISLILPLRASSKLVMQQSYAKVHSNPLGFVSHRFYDNVIFFFLHRFNVVTLYSFDSLLFI